MELLRNAVSYTLTLNITTHKRLIMITVLTLMSKEREGNLENVRFSFGILNVQFKL